MSALLRDDVSIELAIAAMRGAGECEDCFRMGLGLVRSACDVAQPRWIGSRYFESSPRIAVVLINPGGGGPRADALALSREADLFRRFHRSGDYEEVRAYFAASLRRGDPWWAWYRDRLGFAHDEIAQINVAWCPTEGNQYPMQMLRHCFGKHTSALLRTLAPDLVVLSGSAVRRFARNLKILLPNAEIVMTLHYAHRESRASEQQEADRLKGVIAALRRRG